MENLRITLAAGETKVFVKAGRYFEIIDSTGPVTIGFYDANGSQNNDATNVQSGFYLAESYSQFDITSATAQTVEVFISDASAGSKRQPGVVRVIDQGADKTSAGKQFYQGATASAQGGLSGVIMVSPNGAIAAVKKLVLGSSIAGQVLIGRCTNNGTSYSLGTPAQSKLVGGTVSAARIGLGTTAAVDPTGAELAGWTAISRVYVPANATIEVALTTPWVLSGANVLVISGQALARDLSCTFDIEEL